MAILIPSGPFELYVKPLGGTSFTNIGCVERGFELTDGHTYNAVRCDNATGESEYDLFYKGRMPIDLTFILNASAATSSASDWEKIYAQWSADVSEMGTVAKLGGSATANAFSAFLAPVSGSSWAGALLPYWVFPLLTWTPDFQIRWNFGSRPTAVPVSWRALRGTRTYSGATYSSYFYRSASAPT